MVGEKHIPLHNLGVGWWDCSMYDGLYPPCYSRSAGNNYPLTTDPRSQNLSFGGYHSAVVLFCFGDGGLGPLPRAGAVRAFMLEVRTSTTLAQRVTASGARNPRALANRSMCSFAA